MTKRRSASTAKPKAAKQPQATEPETESIDTSTVQDVMEPRDEIVGVQILIDPPRRCYVGRNAQTEFPECRGLMITDIEIAGSAVRIKYGNGMYEEYDKAAVSLLYERETTNALGP